MKRRICLLILLVCLCLTALLCACAGPEEGPEGTEAPVSTAAPAPQPLAAHAEAEGAELGPVYALDGQRYLALKELDAAWSLAPAEGEGTLTLRAESGDVTLRAGSPEAEGADGSRLALGAPALRTEEDWYLPEGALKALWGLVPVYDGETLRCLRVQAGSGVCLNGTALEGDCLCDGVPALPATQLAALCAGVEEGEKDGRPALTLTAGESSLVFTAGAALAELDGEKLALPIPAWQDEGLWYLPAQASAEALGCSVFSDTETGRLGLWKAESGTPFWFAGVGFAHAICFGETPCGSLTELAAALDGQVEAEADAVTLTALSHTLRFRRGEVSAEADGEALALPCPAVPTEEDWLVPLAPLAAALELQGPFQYEKGPVWTSRIEPCETLIYLDGRAEPAFTLPEGGLYVLLDNLGKAAGGSFALSVNEASFTVWGKEATVWGGSATAVVDGTELTLEHPVLADGASWCVPVELLPALGLTELVDPELDQRYYTRIAKHDEIPTGCRVPVLMYHAVSDDNIWGIPELFVSPVQLEKQIQAMLDAGYTPITFEDLDRIDEIEKPVMLTFDDGYDDNYTELFPLLQKYNVKATVFMIVNDIGKNHKLTKERIKEMSDSGLVSIQSHTLSHGYLDEMYESQLHRENRDSMIALARITGKQPFVLCYPTGRSSGASREITAQYYEYGLCMGGPCWVTGDAPYRIYRYYISRYTDVDTFLSYLAG